MKIGLMSDTHSYLDPKVFEHFENCDEVWHAGDIGSVAVAKEMEDFKPFRAVWGNIDHGKLRQMYPEDLRFDCEGLDVFITHIGGYPGRYHKRAKKILTESPPKLYICGHSHILKVMPDRALGFLHMNPGACGNVGYHKMKTLLRFDVLDGKVQNLEAIEIGKRGKLQS